MTSTSQHFHVRFDGSYDALNAARVRLTCSTYPVPFISFQELHPPVQTYQGSGKSWPLEAKPFLPENRASMFTPCNWKKYRVTFLWGPEMVQNSSWR